MNKYTVYIPSKGRADIATTPKLLEGLKYYIVVEPQDYEDYKKYHDKDRILVMDKNDMGVGYARNWIKKYSTETGDEFHWQMDDDMIRFELVNKGKKTTADTELVITKVEEFVERYENVDAASLSHNAFVFSKPKPFDINQMVAGVYMVRNNTIYEYSDFGEDYDLSIQILENGRCTILFNAFCFHTKAIAKTKGGNYDWYMNDGKRKRTEFLMEKWKHLPIRIKYNKDGEPNTDTSKVWKSYTQPLIKK